MYNLQYLYGARIDAETSLQHCSNYNYSFIVLEPISIKRGDASERQAHICWAGKYKLLITTLINCYPDIYYLNYDSHWTLGGYTHVSSITKHFKQF